MKHLLNILLFITPFLAQAIDYEALFQFDAGARKDHLKWKTTFLTNDVDGTKEKVSSKLDLNKIPILQVGGVAKGFVDDCLYVRVSGDFGWIQSSHAKGRERIIVSAKQEIRGDPVTSAAYVAIHNKLHGHVYDISAGVGYPFYFFCHDLQFIPMVGYFYDRQYIHIKDRLKQNLNITLDVAGFTEANIGQAHLKGKFRAMWNGPWLGYDLFYRFDECWSLTSTFEYHFEFSKQTFSGPLALVPIDHSSHKPYGHGYYVDVGAQYYLWCQCLIGIDLFYQSAYAGSSHNKTDWNSFGGNFTAGYIF